MASVARDQLRLEGALTVSGYLDRQLAKLALQGLRALAVARVSGQILYRLVLSCHDRGDRPSPLPALSRPAAW